ncbi:MAG: nucleoside-diphosphate kinase [Polyangia bacterium]
MALERTLAIIKPDAVAKNAVGAIIATIEKAGLRVVGLRQLRLSQAQAEGFYGVHRERPFFPNLVAFMTSGPCVVMALEADNAIQRWRELMGPTDSTKAPPGTIRASFGSSIERNAVHGSDAPDTARFELGWMFAGAELGLPASTK